MKEPRQGFPEPALPDPYKRSDDGVWALLFDELRCNIPRLLQVAELADTQENRNLAAYIAIAMARDYFPNARIIWTWAI